MNLDSRPSTLALLGLLACRPTPVETAQPSGTPPPTTETSETVEQPERACVPASELQPAAREPLGVDAASSIYPPTYAFSDAARGEALAAELGETLELETLEWSRYGDLIEVLRTRSPDHGASSECGFTQAEVERWADLLRDHAAAWGIDRRFELAPAGEGVLHVAHGELDLHIEIVIEGETVRTRGHFWPGLGAPDTMLRADAIAAQAKRWRAYRSERDPQPVNCKPGQPCNQQVLLREVESRPLRASDIASSSLAWAAVGNDARLEFRLWVTLTTHKLGVAIVEAVDGTQQSSLDQALMSVLSIAFVDEGQALLGLLPGSNE